MISALAPAFVPSGLADDEEQPSRGAGGPAVRRTPPGTVASRRGGKPPTVSSIPDTVSDDGRELSPSHHRRSLSEPRKALAHRNSAPAESLTESLAAGGSAARPKRKKVSHLYKTELCVGFMETGTCPYGASCLFAHGGTELRRPDRHPKYKTKKCSSYHNTGYCPFGDHCVFIHEPEDEGEAILMYSTTPASEAGSRTPYRKAMSSTPLISTTPLSEVSSTGATFGSGPGLLSAAAVSASLASTLGSTSSYLSRTTAAATAAATLGAGEVSGNLDSDEEAEELVAEVLEKGVSADFASESRLSGSWAKEHRRSHTISSSSPTTVFSGSEVFGPGLIGVPGEPVPKVKGLRERKSSGSYSASARLEFSRPIAESGPVFAEPSRAFSDTSRSFGDRPFSDSSRAFVDSSTGRSLSMLGEEMSKGMEVEGEDSARSSLASLGSRGGSTAKVIGPSFSGRERKLSSSSASAAERSSSADRWEMSSVLNPADKIIHHERSPSADRWKSVPKPIQPKRLKQSLSSDGKSSESKDYERDLSSSFSAIDISGKKRLSGTASMITPMVVEEDPSESMRKFSSGRASQSKDTASLFSSYPSLFSLKSTE